ncbi:MAG: hypothetical protein ACRC31_03665 [Cetobacterium sp.]
MGNILNNVYIVLEWFIAILIGYFITFTIVLCLMTFIMVLYKYCKTNKKHIK